MLSIIACVLGRHIVYPVLGRRSVYSASGSASSLAAGFLFTFAGLTRSCVCGQVRERGVHERHKHARRVHSTPIAKRG